MPKTITPELPAVAVAEALDLRELRVPGQPAIRLLDRTPVDYPTGYPATTAPIEAPTPMARLATRTFDIAVSGLAIIVLAPVMAVVALAIMIESPGPILYGSRRIGHRRPYFTAWKFRSMHPDAERALSELLARDRAARAEYEVYHKLKADPRLTAVGALIRRLSLDELPQLFNILSGEMSVVGPRPKLPTERSAFGPALPAVLSVKPGLTGLWQVSGRNELPVSDRVDLDLEYVRTRTLGGDLRICLTTVAHLLRPGRHGAY